MVRPDVVLFGELIQDRGIEALYRELDNGFDVTFSIGTSSVFPYIQQPIRMAKEGMNVSVEINPSETVVSSIVDYRILLGAAEALDAIWNRYTV